MDGKAPTSTKLPTDCVSYEVRYEPKSLSRLLEVHEVIHAVPFRLFAFL
jgi:hypothetical protein